MKLRLINFHYQYNDILVISTVRVTPDQPSKHATSQHPCMQSNGFQVGYHKWTVLESDSITCMTLNYFYMCNG